MGGFIPQCTFEAMRQAHIAACDVSAGDTVRDGIISNPFACNFSAARSMVGTPVANCAAGAITTQQASAYDAILAGPRAVNGTQLWYGWLPGANFTLGSAASWMSNFAVQLANLSSAPVTAANFERVFARSIDFFNNNLSATSTNLSPFRAAGGKLLTWHGLYDNAIFPEGTMDYHQRVVNALGGAQNVDSFYRVFLAPGVGHCGNGVGPVPLNPINALVDWVERGRAPDTLPAVRVDGGRTVSRNVCRVGFSPQFSGGDANNAASWTCQPAQQNLPILDSVTQDDVSVVSSDVVNGAATLVGSAWLAVLAAAAGLSLML